MEPEISTLTAARTVVASTGCFPFGWVARRAPGRSVLFRDRELDVDRGEDREDVRLEEGHQDFEQGEVEAEGEGSGAHSRPPAAEADDDNLRRGDEQPQHQ